MEYFNIDGQHFYNMVINACNKLEEQKEFVNSLNVFPVPDGDTGTNMSMTFRAAVSEIKESDKDSIGEVSKKLARGALMGARGNSGVILSQILRGIAKGLEGKTSVEAFEFAQSLMEGSKSAYKAVMRPTEGTILTIIRAAGEAAANSNEADIVTLMKQVCKQSEIMLNRTPEMLPVLKKAKVVDSGGMGLLIILKGMYEALSENISDINISEVKEDRTNNIQLIEEEIKYGYCTEFIILCENADYENFRDEIGQYGDSMIVVGVDDVIKVHIHTNDPGLILSKAVKLGELSKIKIDNMREEHRHVLLNKQKSEESYTNTDDISKDEIVKTENEEEKKYAFVSVALGEGIKNIFKDLGVDFVIEGGQTMNPSTQDILDCINNINAENIFVLPNNKNIIMAATQAAELSEKNVVVIATKSIPQGITTITVFNPEASIEENTKAMNESINNVATGSITYAVRDTEMDGINIKEGDIIGLVEGKIVEVGNDMFEVCEKIIHRMTNEDSELLTVFYGKDCDRELVENFVEKLEDDYSQMDVQSYNGEQPLYYFIVSVE